MDNQQKQQAVERVKQANNILVTVSNNPSVDQLAACIGVTLGLNKLGKHATAVFSGAVPDIIEFLQPEKTLEKTTDSLRDFIIALDKSKADKLRYKVEDKVVKIFITPYRTSIGQEDLIFSQGDFNVDVVLALGVHIQAELDQAITAHGRILHDATVISVNTKPGGELGTINWLESQASSLSELAAQIVAGIDKSVIDSQIATAFLTGIVAETQRFSNAKTSPRTMSISAELMAAGANQQLVATKLEPKPPPPPPLPPAPPAPAPPPPKQPSPAVEAPKFELQGKSTAAAKKDEGTLEIDHGSRPVSSLESLSGTGEEQLPPEPLMPQIDIDREGVLRRIENLQKAENATEAAKAAIAPESHVEGTERPVLHPPSMGGQANAVGTPGGGALFSTDPLSLPQPGGPILSREAPYPSPDQTSELPSNNPQVSPTVASSSMLSHHDPVNPSPDIIQPLPDAASARNAVMAASSNQPPQPDAALNATHLDLGKPIPPPSSAGPEPHHGLKVINPLPHQPDQPLDPNAPPPAPPPMMPPMPQP